MSWDTGNTDFSSGNAQFDFSSGTAQMDFGSGNAGFDQTSNQNDFSTGGQQDFSSGGQQDFSGGGGGQDFSATQNGGQPPIERSPEDTLKFKNYKWASNRTRYEFNENAVDEHGMAPRDEDLEKELFGETEVHAGLDFSRYANIPVSVERGQAPPRIHSFDEAALHPLMKDNVRLAHYTVPTPVQTIAIPVVTSGKDLMACAQTGSGKTAAFLIPTLSALFQNAAEVQKPRPAPHELRTYKAEPLILIIAPTRELCSQIFDDCRRFTYRSCLRPCAVYGGADTVGQLRQLERGCDVLAASPGRLIDFIQRGKIALTRVKYLILDEADRMLDMGFEGVIREIIQKQNMNVDRQTLLFSATFPRTIRALARDFLKPDYLFVKVGRVGGIPNSLTQKFMLVEEDEKRQSLEELLKSHPPTRTLIFVETKRSADSLDQYLYERAFPSTSIHGDRSQMEREDAILAFKRGVCPILVATAVAARGIDIPNVMHVINYDMPKDMDEYIHRIGRTARQGRSGLATSFYNSASDLIATELYKLLKECNQEIPECLSIYQTEDTTFDEDLDDTGVEQPSYAGQEFVPPEKYVPGGAPAGGESGGVDWECPSCNISNYASRQVCFKCQTPKSGESGGATNGFGGDFYGGGGDSFGYSGDSGGYGGGGGRGGKPGDWDCPECSQSNFASRYECFKCHAAKPEGAGGDSGGYGGGYGGGGRSGGKPGDWDCPECSQSNFASRYECFKCHAAKPEGAGGDSGGLGGGGRSGGKPGDWDCPDCSQSNFASRGECFKCGAARPAHLGPPARREPRARREGDWDCSSCAAVNFSNRTDCFKCHASKEGGDAGGGYDTSYDNQDSGAAGMAGDSSWDPSSAAAGWSGGANTETVTATTSGGGDWNASSANQTAASTGGDWNAPSANKPAASTGGDWNAPSNTSAPAPQQSSGGWNQTTTAPPATQAPAPQQTGGWNQQGMATPPVTQQQPSSGGWNQTAPPVTQAPVAQQASGGWNQTTTTTPPVAQQSTGGWNQQPTAPPATQAPVVAQQSGGGWDQSQNTGAGGWNQPSSNAPQQVGGGWTAPAPVQQQAPPVQQQAPPVQQQAPPVQQQAPPVTTGGGWGAAPVNASGW